MAADGPWTIDQLSAEVADALVIDYPGPPSGRVREVPDRRTIRWYTTIGLLDRPAAMRGRTALYGRRHLLQLVAIKRLQANGYSLAAVQEELYGATDTTLTRIAQLPEPADEPSPVGGLGDGPASDGRLSGNGELFGAGASLTTHSATSVHAGAATPPRPDGPALGGLEMSLPGRPFPIEPELPARPGPLAPQPGQTVPPGEPLPIQPEPPLPAQPAFPPSVSPGEPLPVDPLRRARPQHFDNPLPGRFWAAVAPPATDPPSTLSAAIRLLDSVTLVLPPGTRVPALDDLAAIQAAAAPLLAVLRQRGLDGTEGNAQ